MSRRESRDFFPTQSAKGYCRRTTKVKYAIMISRLTGLPTSFKIGHAPEVRHLESAAYL